MKHLEKFQNFNYQKINEEKGVLSTIALATALLFNNVEAYPQSVGVKTEVVSQNPKLYLNFLEGSTSDTKCFNNALYKFGLTKTQSKFYSCTVGEFKARIGKDTTQILADFKPINLDVKAQDYLKVGNIQLSDNGTQVFDLTDDNKVIIGSANGLLALTRVSRAADSNVDYSMMRVTFKSERRSRAVSYDLGDRLDMTGSCNTLAFMFETSITPRSKFDPTSIGMVALPKLIEASENYQIEYITSFINNSVRKFIPKEIVDEVLRDFNFNKFDSTIIKEFLQECRKDGKVDSVKFNQKIIPLFKEFYADNFRLFADTYFPDGLNNQIYQDYSKELVFQTGKFHPSVWKKSTYRPATSSKPTYKAPEFNYGEGK